MQRWFWAPLVLLGCAPSPHIYAFDGGPRACQTVEICNGIDDDCNGEVDDLLVAPAATNQVGVCMGALKRCEEGGWQEPAVAADEGGEGQACDGQDNDCDGAIDEDYDAEARPCAPERCTEQCCELARMHCLDGEVHCLVHDARNPGLYRLPYSGVERCDGIDSDCDGSLEEDGCDPDA